MPAMSCFSIHFRVFHTHTHTWQARTDTHTDTCTRTHTHAHTECSCTYIDKEYTTCKLQRTLKWNKTKNGRRESCCPEVYGLSSSANNLWLKLPTEEWHQLWTYRTALKKGRIKPAHKKKVKEMNNSVSWGQTTQQYYALTIYSTFFCFQETKHT